MIGLISGILVGFITITGIATFLGYGDISNELEKQTIVVKYNHE